MKKLILIPVTILAIIGCGINRSTPLLSTSSIEVHKVDSIIWHDSVIVSYITKERYKDIVALPDTLRLETDYAKSISYIDTTTATLQGSIENKSTTPVKTSIKWKEKIEYKDSIIFVEREVPVDREVIVTKYPASYWVLLGFTVVVLLHLGIKLYLKIKL